MNQWYSSPLHTFPTTNSSHQFHRNKLRLSVRIQSVTVQSVQSPGPFSVVWLSRFKQKKPRGQCPFSLSFHYNKGGAVPNKDGHLSVGSDFLSFLQDVFEERDNDCCNMEDLLVMRTWQLSHMQVSRRPGCRPQHTEREDKGANCESRLSMSQKMAGQRSLCAKKRSIESSRGTDCYTLPEGSTAWRREREIVIDASL